MYCAFVCLIEARLWMLDMPLDFPQSILIPDPYWFTIYQFWTSLYLLLTVKVFFLVRSLNLFFLHNFTLSTVYKGEDL